MELEKLAVALAKWCVVAAAVALWGCHSEHLGQVKIDEANVMVSDDSKAWKKTVDSHTEPSGALLYMSWFPTTRSEGFVELHPDGNGSSGVIHDGVGMFSLKPIAVSHAELDEVKDEIRQLPLWTAMVNQGSLVLVSYQTDSDWHTRGYDRNALPAPVQRLFELTHTGIDLSHE